MAKKTQTSPSYWHEDSQNEAAGRYYRNAAIKEAFSDGFGADLPEEAPKKEGYAALESSALRAQEDRSHRPEKADIFATETVAGTPDRRAGQPGNLEGEAILKRTRADHDTLGDERRRERVGEVPNFEDPEDPFEFGDGREAAAAKAVAVEQGAGTFDLGSPQAWTGAGGYSYSYAPGDGGEAGTITATSSDGRTAQVKNGSRFWNAILAEKADPDNYDPAKYGLEPEPTPEPDYGESPTSIEPDFGEDESDPDYGKSPSIEPDLGEDESDPEYESQLDDQEWLPTVEAGQTGHAAPESDPEPPQSDGVLAPGEFVSGQALDTVGSADSYKPGAAFDEASPPGWGGDEHAQDTAALEQASAQVKQDRLDRTGALRRTAEAGAGAWERSKEPEYVDSNLRGSSGAVSSQGRARVIRPARFVDELARGAPPLNLGESESAGRPAPHRAPSSEGGPAEGALDLQAALEALYQRRQADALARGEGH